MADKPSNINRNVASWMLPKDMREQFPASSKKSSFSSVLESRQKPARSSGGRGPRRQGTDYNPHSAGHRTISMQHAKRLAQYAPIINHCARKYRVPVSLICGVMLQESGGNPNAVSHCGARGLMQLMPATAKRFGVTSIMDPRQNIEGGVRYLSYLRDHFKGNVPLMVAAYNAGEGNVAKYGNKIPPFAETQNYVPSVLGFARSIQDLLTGGVKIEKAEAISTQSPLPRFMKLA